MSVFVGVMDGSSGMVTAHRRQQQQHRCELDAVPGDGNDRRVQRSTRYNTTLRNCVFGPVNSGVEMSAGSVRIRAIDLTPSRSSDTPSLPALRPPTSSLLSSPVDNSAVKVVPLSFSNAESGDDVWSSRHSYRHEHFLSVGTRYY